MNYKEEIKKLQARVEELEKKSGGVDKPQHEFKVGDIVKILIKPFIEGSCNFKLGDIVYIQGILNDNYYCLVKTNGEVISYGFERDELEYVGKAIDEPRCVFTEPEPRWSFTEDEKTILSNLDAEWNYIVRDRRYGSLCIFTKEPKKYEEDKCWKSHLGLRREFPFDHANLFECIKWSDDEPCEFRKFL